MFDLESLGLLGLFIGTFLAATILPFSSDALYIAVLAATKDPIGCLAVGTVGNWLGSVVTYWIGWIGRWEWIEKWFKVKRETLEKQDIHGKFSDISVITDGNHPLGCFVHLVELSY